MSNKQSCQAHARAFSAALVIPVEALQVIAGIVPLLVELRQKECRHLCIEDMAPELFGKLIHAYLDATKAGDDSGRALPSDDPSIAVLHAVLNKYGDGTPPVLIQKDLSGLLNLWEQIATRLRPSDSCAKAQDTDRTGC